MCVCAEDETEHGVDESDECDECVSLLNIGGFVLSNVVVVIVVV